MSRKKKILKDAIDIIELANSYYLLSNDRKSKPVFVGNRIRLEFVLLGIKEDMVIVTSGDPKGRRCLVLVDFTGDEVLQLALKADKKITKLRSKN